MYPSEEFLKEVEETEVKNLQEFHTFMDKIKDNWEFADWGWTRGTKDGNMDVYFVSTGGWSGNEDIIHAMHKNLTFWMFYWQEQRRGGHYIFCPIGTDLP